MRAFYFSELILELTVNLGVFLKSVTGPGVEGLLIMLECPNIDQF